MQVHHFGCDAENFETRLKIIFIIVKVLSIQRNENMAVIIQWYNYSDHNELTSHKLIKMNWNGRFHFTESIRRDSGGNLKSSQLNQQISVTGTFLHQIHCNSKVRYYLIIS